MRKLGVVLTVLILALLGWQAFGAKTPQFTAKQQDDIREAVFRKLLPDTKMRYNPDVYFLALSDEKGLRDPTKAFIVRLKDCKLSIKPQSASKRSERLDQVRDKATDAEGAIVYVEPIKHLADTKAELEGGYYANGRAGAIHKFAVELRRGKWVVTKQKLLIVS